MHPSRQRTQKRLQDALIALIHEREFEDIRVIDLVERADIALPTFYRNYENKLDLLQDTLQSIMDRIDALHIHMDFSIDKMLQADQPPPVLPFARFIDENRIIFQRLMRTPYHQLVFDTLLKMSAEKVRQDTPEWLPHEVDLIVGSMMGCLYQWLLSEEPRYTADEIAYMIHWTTLSGVLALRGRLNTAGMASLVDAESD